MAEVLVLAEHTADGEVKKVTLELLTAARRLGSPSAVWTGPGADDGLARLAEYGAEKVYVADSADFAARPPRAAGVIVKDEGDGGTNAAGFLAERKFI